MDPDKNKFNSTAQAALDKFVTVKNELGKVIVGQISLIDKLLTALLADGHVILEGVPGLAKTLAVTSLAQTISCDFKRIQFTPDLLPADLIGTSIYQPHDGSFSIKKGPIFTHILLADEINRAPAKVQSALLEVMQEKQVTIAGETFKIDNPYMVLATQNPIEQAGTYPLPEAQTDRFMMKIKIDYPSMPEEKEIIGRMATLGPRPYTEPIISGSDILETRKIVNTVYIDEKITDYILNIIFSTRQPERFGIDIKGLLEFGASPRAGIAMQVAGMARAFLSGRMFVTPHDIKSICHDILRHRLRLSYEAEAQELTTDDVIDRILSKLPVP